MAVAATAAPERGNGGIDVSPRNLIRGKIEGEGPEMGMK